MSASDFEILGAAHTGITVSSVDAALAFWHETLGFPILMKDVALSEETPLPKMVGVPGAALKAALVTLPNGHIVELLEYTGPAERQAYHPRPCDVGSVHVALDVKGIEAIVAKVEKLDGWKRRGDPQAYENMPGGTWTMAYLRGPDGEAVELIQRPS